MMVRKERGAVMVEYIVVSVFFAMLVYYALVGGDNAQCRGTQCVSGGALSSDATEGTGYFTRYAFDQDEDGTYTSLNDGREVELHSYSGVAQSLRAKQDSFSQSIYQP